jgi:hypothetical protein
MPNVISKIEQNSSDMNEIILDSGHPAMQVMYKVVLVFKIQTQIVLAFSAFSADF